MPRAKTPRCEMVSDGHDVFVVVDGVKIAERGRPRHAAGEDVDLARARLGRA